MNLRNKIATFALASVLALGAVSPAFANTTTTKVTQEITAGSVLRAELAATSSMNSISFSHDAQTSTGTLVLRVEDGRGTNAGWQVTMNADNFRPVNIPNAQPIPNSGFAFVNGGDVTASPGSRNGIQNPNQNVSMASGKAIIKADKGSGTGVYHQPLNVTLAIPAGQAVGIYQSDVTVNITSGPGN